MPKSKHRRKAGEKAVPHSGRAQVEPGPELWGNPAGDATRPEKKKARASAPARALRRTQPACRCSPPRPSQRVLHLRPGGSEKHALPSNAGVAVPRPGRVETPQRANPAASRASGKPPT